MATPEKPKSNLLRGPIYGVFINIVLAITKIVAGVLGHCYALIADGIESTLDIIGSLIVWRGLIIANEPPDEDHPYGHGKAESLTTLVVGITLLVGAALIAYESVLQILTPHISPAPFTLIVLVVVIIIKEIMYRTIMKIGVEHDSNAVKGDAFHHRSDALTSAAAFIGISIALIKGPGYESADDWAALFACSIITYNGVKLCRNALSEVMDAAPPPELEQEVRKIASAVDGVITLDKCRLRKYGLVYFVDLHVVVDANLSVRRGHEIAHAVKEALIKANLKIADTLVHIEPAEPEK